MKKVLHIIENFNGQATENWLLQLMMEMTARNEKFEWTFFSTLGVPGSLDSVALKLGAKIIYSPTVLRNKIKFILGLRRCIINGGYDIIHSHHDIVSAIYLCASVGLPVRKKIIHLHNTSNSLPTSSKIINFLLREPMRKICLYFANHIVGVSKDALDTFLNGFPRAANRHFVIHCGIDLTPYQSNFQRRNFLLKKLNLPNHSKNILFVGRMISYKNPDFVIHVLEHLLKLDSNYYAIFAGTGPLQMEVLKLAKEKSLVNRIRVLGWYEDIPGLMRSCDILIWPGHENVKEGLGLAIIEAQAAGTPILMSKNVPDDAIVVPKIVTVLSISLGAKIWANKILSILSSPMHSKNEALLLLENSSFTISQSAKNILALYEN